MSEGLLIEGSSMLRFAGILQTSREVAGRLAGKWLKCSLIPRLQVDGEYNMYAHVG